MISDPFSGSDSTTYTYDAANRMLTSQSVSGTTSYTYDANGNQASIEEPNGDLTTNTWDDENRLVQVEHPDNSLTTYAYNADGQRVLKESPAAVVTWFVHDEKNVLLEIDDADAVECEFTYDPQAYAHTLSQRRDGDSSFYHFDGTMNTAALTDATSIVTDEYVVDAWGKLRSATGSTANSQIYKGEYLAYRRDPDTGPDEVYTLEYRHYGPSAGRFNSLDPAEDDLNLYRYVANNPVNEADPSGLGPQDDWLENRLSSGRIDRERLRQVILTSSEFPAPAPTSSTDAGFDAGRSLSEQLRDDKDFFGHTIDWTKAIDVRTGKPVRTKESKNRTAREEPVGETIYEFLKREIDSTREKIVGLAENGLLPDEVAESGTDACDLLRDLVEVLEYLDLDRDTVLDLVQLALDVIGLIPAVGNLMDGLNAAISLLRRDWLGVGLSAIAAIPAIGQFTGVARIAKRIKTLQKANKKLRGVLSILEGFKDRVLNGKIRNALDWAKSKLDSLKKNVSDGPDPRHNPPSKPDLPQGSTPNPGGGPAPTGNQRLFDLDPLKRGRLAESDPRLLPGGRQGLPFNARVIDQLPATSATTIDLAAKSYQSASGLRSRILGKAKALESFEGSPKVLRVGVPDDVVPTDVQARTLQQLMAELQQKGIELVIVPIN